MLDEALGFLADYRHRKPDLSVAVNLELGTVPASGLSDMIAGCSTSTTSGPICSR
jgi:hypothetical protein